jgi:hypothetical protein
MPGKKLFFLGNEEVGALVDNDSLGERVGAILENDVLPFEAVHGIIQDILDREDIPRGITGWYYQQFLKMQYARICQDEYYMVWDGDTVPCQLFSMYTPDGKMPYLDLKTEYHEEYFKTITKLFPDMFKCIQKSFISEHMLFQTQIMREMLNAIESNAFIKGTAFYEKILYAVGQNKILGNNFSEFETYGTYVALRHPDAYRLRTWHSFRYGGAFFAPNRIDEQDYAWLAKDFFAISFEKNDTVRADHQNLFDNKEYQRKLSARQMLEIAQEEFGAECYKEVWD